MHLTLCKGREMDSWFSRGLSQHCISMVLLFFLNLAWVISRSNYLKSEANSQAGNLPICTSIQQLSLLTSFFIFYFYFQLKKSYVAAYNSEISALHWCKAYFIFSFIYLFVAGCPKIYLLKKLRMESLHKAVGGYSNLLVYS